MHLQDYATKHAISIREDVEALCEELKSSPEELCRIWMFKTSSCDFIVFEEISTHRILGCVRAVDKREVDEATWNELWGDFTK